MSNKMSSSQSKSKSKSESTTVDKTTGKSKMQELARQRLLQTQQTLELKSTSVSQYRRTSLGEVSKTDGKVTQTTFNHMSSASSSSTNTSTSKPHSVLIPATAGLLEKTLEPKTRGPILVEAQPLPARILKRRRSSGTSFGRRFERTCKDERRNSLGWEPRSNHRHEWQAQRGLEMTMYQFGVKKFPDSDSD